MSERNLDSKGRWRKRIVAFRVSDAEANAIDEAVRLSGLTKQDYIIRKLLDRDVIVAKSPRTYKALKDTMDEIIRKLNAIKTAGDCTDEFLQTIEYVTTIYSKTKEDYQ